MRSNIRRYQPACFVLVTLAFSGPSASAGLIAADSYQIGTSPASGQYQANLALFKQSNAIVSTGFANGATGAFGGGSQSSQFSALNATTFGYAPFGANASNAGEVNFQAAPLDGATRSDARSLTAAATATAGGSTGTSLWFNVLVSSDGISTSTNGSVLASIGNSVVPAYGTTIGNYSGLGFGFASHSATDTNDLVIRYRSGGSTNSDVTLVSNTSGVYDIVARLDVNVNGTSTDRLTYWVNPTDFSSQAALDSTSLLTNDGNSLATFASQGIGAGANADFTRLTYTATNWNGNDNFGDVAFGTSLSDLASDLVTVPEPGSILMLGMGLISLAGLAVRRRALAVA